VALARAIVLNPKVLLLDEPLSNLDAKLRKELRKEILDLHRLANITTIFVTHDLEEAFSLSDVVAVMNAGRIEQVGAPIDIYHHPKTTFVANFIGYSNIFERNRPFGDAADAVRIGEGEATPSSGRFAVPAQSVHVSTTPLHTDTVLKGTISQIMFLGARMQITVDAGGQTIQAELPVNPTVHALGKGAEVFLGWNADEIVPLPEEQ